MVVGTYGTHVTCRHIHVVDQRLIAREVARTVLGVTISVVGDGEAALEYLRHDGRFANSDTCPSSDLIPMDINLPKIDGQDVLFTIHAVDRLRDDADNHIIYVDRSTGDPRYVSVGCKCLCGKTLKFH